MRFRYIPPGTFQMGSPLEEPGRYDDEAMHEGTLTSGYWLAETEGTQGQWLQVMGNNPSRFQRCGDNCPVEQVSWYEAVAFANALSRKAGFRECYQLTGCQGAEAEDMRCSRAVAVGSSCSGYRLPTEAEWERAARAGTETALYTGPLVLDGWNHSRQLEAIAWYRENGGAGTHTVGEKQPNEWNLVDMLGNVWEWCDDWYSPFVHTAARDPRGPEAGLHRVCRGGSWRVTARSARAASRGWRPPGDSANYLGFRLALGQGFDAAEAEPPH